MEKGVHPGARKRSTPGGGGGNKTTTKYLPQRTKEEMRGLPGSQEKVLTFQMFVKKKRSVRTGGSKERGASIWGGASSAT